jgi:hypothetical protein
MPTPTIGQPLPRVAEAYTTPKKWSEWILADRGHGREWAKIFHVELVDAEIVWQTIVDGVLHGPVYKVIDRGRDGIVCGVELELTIKSRVARVRTSWHYECPDAAPRLVTAYPSQ